MKVVAVILARQESKRFPSKVMADIEGVPMLGRIVERMTLAKTINQVVVATNSSSPDIIKYCRDNGINLFIGSEYDVLDRLYQASKTYEAGVIVRVWHDSPLIEPKIIDRLITDFIVKDYDFAFLRNYPKGMLCNIMRFPALEKLVSDITIIDRAIWNQVSEEWVWSKSGFKVNIYHPPIDFSDLSFEVNTPEDLERIRAIFKGEGDV